MKPKHITHRPADDHHASPAPDACAGIKDPAALRELIEAAKDNLATIHRAIEALGTKSHCHDVQAMLAYESQALAAAIAKVES
jgi:hypothetical protein